MCFRPLKHKGIVFYHVTEMQFVSKEVPLHCWKRNNGFFASLDELMEKFLLPSHGHEALAELLASASVGSDICFMLEPELLFLKARATAPTPGKRKCLTPTSVEAIIDRAHYYTKHEKQKKRDVAQGLKNMQGVLINLAYLRKMYTELAKSVHWLVPHTKSKFYIKHWPHRCPFEKVRQHDGEETEDGQNLAEEQEESDAEEITELPERRLERSGEKGGKRGRGKNDFEGEKDGVQQEDEMVDSDEHEIDSAAETEANNKELPVDSDDAEDVQVLEDIEEAEKEIIDLVDSSSEEEDESDHNEENEGGDLSSQAEDGDQGYLSVTADFVNPDDISNETPLQHNRNDDSPQIKQKSMNTEGGGTSDFAQQEQTVKEKDAARRGIKQEQLEHENDDLGHGGHDLGPVSHDPEYARQPQEVLGSIEVSHIKQERLEEVDSDLLDLNIKQEVSEADEYLTNLPIAIISNFTSHQMPGDQQEAGRNNTLDTAIQMKEEKTEEEEEEADEDSNSDDSEAVSFKVEDFSRLCSCPVDDQNNVLTSSSILQSYFNTRNNCIYVLEHVGQAAIGEHLLYTFNIKGTLYFSLAQLQDLGLVLPGLHIDCFRCRGPGHWVQKGGPYEITFLCNSNVPVPLGSSTPIQTRSYMLSVELFCFLSYEGKIVTQMVRQSDICLHKIGHICPDPLSRAWKVLQRNADLGMVMKAWSKSFFWQEQLKGVEERRLLGNQPTKPQDIRFPSSSCPQTGAKNTELAWPVGEPIVISGKIKVPIPRLNAKPVPVLPQKDQRPLFKLFKSHTASECALYIRKCKDSDLQVDNKVSATSSSTYYVCSPNSKGGAKIVKRKTVEIEVPQKTCSKGSIPTNIYEGAMLPKWYKDKNQCLKTGVGFVELDTTAIDSWIGDKSSTHHLLLTGTLTTGMGTCGRPMTFSCFKINDKLYINWGELAAQIVGVGTVFELARKLYVFLYSVPTMVGVHFSRHYGASTDMVCSKPWLCVNSVNAVAWLGIIDKVSHMLFPKTFSVLVEHFHKTDNWNLQFRNFLLIPKGELLPRETFFPR